MVSSLLTLECHGITVEALLAAGLAHIFISDNKLLLKIIRQNETKKSSS